MDSLYRANAIHPSFGGRTATGTISVLGDRLRFESELGHVELPMSSLGIRAGGHNNEQFFFSHPQHADWTIYSSDRRLLEERAFSWDPSLARQVKAIQKKPRFSLPLLAAGLVLLLLLLGVGALVASKDRLIRYAAFQIPAGWETQLGTSMFEQIRRDGKIISDPGLEAKLKAASAPLLRSVSGYSFQFHLLDDTNINAFAIPGGIVVVHTGLLQAAGRPEEIAGVLAHEIAHVTQRHGFRKILESVGLFIALRAIVGDSSGLTTVIAESSQFLLNQKYSRDFEREADDVGWEYLLESKIDPRGLIEFFKRLEAAEKNAGTVPGWLSTHPATEERIRRLESKWEKLENKQGFQEL